ncbi:hypothetical protein [Thalassovita sp.]|uniref:hypothetical protein n=1 Tax=Thalassovita sp. TaxID=1979401 RepID=UPI002B26707E|nr:hypothetical protein [Thalassovita sp.]
MATEPFEIRFKPDALRGSIRFLLDGALLMRLAEDGAVLWQIDLHRVRRVDFVETRNGEAVLRRLDLAGPGGRHRIGVKLDTAQAADSADGAAHLALVEAVARALAETRPGFPVGIGDYGRARLIMFALGVTGAMSAVGLGIAVLISAGSRAGDAALPLGGLLVLGAAVSWFYAPWKPVLSLPASDIPALVQGVRDAAQS